MEVRDEVVAFVEKWSEAVNWTQTKMLTRIGVSRSKYGQWRSRRGVENQPDGVTPRSGWLTPCEQDAIEAYRRNHPEEGYRRLSYMMLDVDVVAASPSSVYRVLKTANLLSASQNQPNQKGTGFTQPTKPHQHWHIDIAFLNICNTFYYLCSVLDGYSRAILEWDILPQMKSTDVEMVVQRAHEKHAAARPRIISDNGPQFIARDFKQLVRELGMQHVRTSPYYPQSNGKIERWHKTLKAESIRPNTPLTVDHARQLVADFVRHYNAERLHSSIGYVTPLDKLNGNAEKIAADRCEKLRQAKQHRAVFWYEKRLYRTGEHSLP